ncbi:hypothetical protein ACSW8Q_17420 (plasmid) [Clostridium perfringens]
MDEIKCIYCGKGKSDGVLINESDIIPESLTKAKIKYKNVCSKDHNSDFSDKFETKVAEELSFLRNHLNIIGKGTGNEFPKYEVSLKIDGITYKRKKVINDANLIGNNKIRSEDGSTLIGPLNEIKKIKNSEKCLKKIIDLNNTEILKSVKLNLGIFISEEIYRLVSKIAYEWFCKVNDINGKNDIFDDIINFIVSGYTPIGYDIVSPISDKNVYNLMKKWGKLGSHYLYSYISSDNEINVIVSFFGLALYKVILCTNIKDISFKESTFSEEFMLIGKKKFISSKDLINLDSFNFDGDINYKIFMLSFMAAIDNMKKEFVLDEFINILINNYQKLLSSSIIEIKDLKRFVKDYNLSENININLNNSDKKFWFLLYLVFYIGKNDIYDLTIESINNLVRNLFLNSKWECELKITEELVLKLKNEILKADNYKNFIEKGSNIILKN